MAYTALYRRLRPDKFDGLVGQEHIVRTLKNQIESNRISHAYLFCGTRGTGKTSTAKIFARAINCETPENFEPCGKCETCVAIQSQRSVNVIEIDAASNNGVDNIRDIREEVKYPPAVGKYKVYIIDEVHMLSAGAFNALLKTLEEPPEHVVFILATTDPQKIPQTILSRCQRFDFRRITVDDMSKTLERYMNEEGIDITAEAVKYIAKLSDGAMRDALSILDQCISFNFEEQITLEKVHEITGSVDNSVFFALANALFERDSFECMEIIDKIVVLGRDINQFAAEFVTHLRNLLVSASSSVSVDSIDFSDENKADISVQGKKIGMSRLMELIYEFSELLSRLKYASNERVIFEVACIKLCGESEKAVSTVQADSGATNELMMRLEKLESKLTNMSKIGVQGQGGHAPQKPSEKAAESVKAAAKAVPDDYRNVLANWRGFTATFKPPESSFLQNTTCGYMDDSYLYIVCDSVGAVSILRMKEEMLRDRLAAAYGKDFELRFMSKVEYDGLHRAKYGKNDDFDYSEEKVVNALKEKLNFDISVE